MGGEVAQRGGCQVLIFDHEHEVLGQGGPNCRQGLLIWRGRDIDAAKHRANGRREGLGGGRGARHGSSFPRLR